MSTRSLVGQWERKSNKIKMIYCHSDGYPEWVGLRLARFYSKKGRVQKLIRLGDLYSIGQFMSYDERREVPFTEEELSMMQRLRIHPYAAHDYQNPLAEVTVAFHRDRGDELDKPISCSLSYPDLIDAAEKNARADYIYLHDGSGWYVATTRSLRVSENAGIDIQKAFTVLDQVLTGDPEPNQVATSAPVINLMINPNVPWGF